MNRTRMLLSAMLAVCLVALGGAIGMSASATERGEGHTPVNVCHATSSDTNPYVFITVDDDSVKFEGHLMHRSDPNKRWKADGTWNGQPVQAGDPKPDLIGDYTDKNGTLHVYDGVITQASDCGEFTLEVTEPEGSFEQVCTADGAEVTIGALDPGTYENVTWTLAYGDQSATVTENQKVAVPPGVPLVLSWANAEDSGAVQRATSADACPPPEGFGKIKLQKHMTGDVAGAETSFTVRVDCPGSGYDQDVSLNASNNWVNITGDIPTGSQCTLTEVKVPRGWNPEGINPDTVTVGSGTPESVTAVVENKRRTGKVTIVKKLEGDTAGVGTEFTVTLDCEGTAYDRTVVLNSSNGWTRTYVGVPSGVECSVSEPTVPVGWRLKSISPATFEIDSYDTITVEVINVRQTGSVEVRKSVVGDLAGATSDFSVLLDCDGTASDRALVLNAANDWSARVGGIPTGLQCQVTEPTVPPGWNLTSISPAGKFVVQAETVVSVSVTNTRATGAISVTKVLQGTVSGAATSFTFDVDCPGTAYDQSLTVDVTTGASASAATRQIPAGLTCTVTERATPDWTLTSVVPTGGVVSVGSTVTFTNQRRQGAMTISKEVSPVAGNGVVVDFGDTLTYTLTVRATGDQVQPNVVVTDYVPGFDPARPGSGKTTYVPGSARCVGGGTCTVTEPGAQGLITWALGEMAGSTTRQVTFQVVIDDISGEPGETIVADIINAGAVQSDRTPRTGSNEVSTPVTKVLPVKEGRQPPANQPPANQPPAGQTGVLPRTGADLPTVPLVSTALFLLCMGVLLTELGRKRGVHRG